MGRRHHSVNAAVIGEHGVLRCVFAGRGHYNLIQEGDVLGARHAVVAVHVIQGKHVVTARLEVAQGELAAVVGAAHALQRQVGERGVVQVAVQADDDVLHRLQVIGPEHDTRYGKGVNLIACRECEGIAVQLVALVVVLDGVREVDDIGRVLLEGVAEFHRYLLAHSADERHGAWGRGDDDLLLLVLEVDDFVKGDFHLVALEIECTGGWRGLDDLWWCVVTRTALGRPDAGTRREQNAHSCRHQPVYPMLAHDIIPNCKGSHFIHFPQIQHFL